MAPAHGFARLALHTYLHRGHHGVRVEGLDGVQYLTGRRALGAIWFRNWARVYYSRTTSSTIDATGRRTITVVKGGSANTVTRRRRSRAWPRLCRSTGSRRSCRHGVGCTRAQGDGVVKGVGSLEADHARSHSTGSSTPPHAVPAEAGVQVVQIDRRRKRSTHGATNVPIGQSRADEPASTSSVEATTLGNLLSAGRCSQQDGGHVFYN